MGTTIGSVVISYDIDKLHTKVKASLDELGYLDDFKFKSKSQIYFLPNTTLWHPKKSSDQAMSDLKLICAKLEVTLEKAITVKATEFVGFDE